jgi:hypothetical protein
LIVIPLNRHLPHFLSAFSTLAMTVLPAGGIYLL